MNGIPDVFGPWLRRCRKARGWTLERAAREIGIPLPALMYYELGDRFDPPVSLLVAIAQTYGTQLAEVVAMASQPHLTRGYTKG